MESSVTLHPHAKINLLLRVLAREADGYHGLETLFCLVSLTDSLTVERREGKGASIEVTGLDAGPPEDNLALRAARAVLDATGHRFSVRLTLEKRIPVRAGLGGGSSDAASALHAVNLLAGNAVPRHELFQFAARLGSDVPFFLSGAPLALAWGHGQRLLRLPPLPSAPAVLLVPRSGIGTAEAYGWIDSARHDAGGRGALALDLDTLSRWGDIGRMAGNDFESVAFAQIPEIRAAFEALVGTRPLVCRMSGSGSALFAIYRSAREREDARMMLGRKHGDLFSVETLAAPPPT
jgi:4-diphosphocytidyl-2-C-methyl-D-erythritol kinase